MNRDGDFAIVKGRWNGFTRKISGDKSRKGKPGAAGMLNVELFNLLRNTVQKLQLPGADGSTLFLIGGRFFKILIASCRFDDVFVSIHSFLQFRRQRWFQKYFL